MTGRWAKRPLAALDLDAFRQAEFQQMADRRREDIPVTFVSILPFGKPAERLGDVAGDRRLFRYNERFSHFMDINWPQRTPTSKRGKVAYELLKVNSRPFFAYDSPFWRT